jgi:ferrous iron transport protein A
VRKGVQIEVLRRAPLGDPTVFELCGYQLCLRRTESARVEVSPLPTPTRAPRTHTP